MTGADVAAGGYGPVPTHLTDAPGAHALTAKRIVVAYGFWIFLLSDIVMFSAFFATYAVLVGQTAGGPSGRDLFDLHNTAIETGCLLLSSFTCGIASICAPMLAMPQVKLDSSRHPVSIAVLCRSKRSRPLGPPAVCPTSTA